jgi:hypothetical protein
VCSSFRGRTGHPLSRRICFLSLRGFGYWSAFHMPKLFFAQRFILRFFLPQIGAYCGSSILILLWITTPGEKSAEEIHDHAQ